MTDVDKKQETKGTSEPQLGAGPAVEETKPLPTPPDAEEDHPMPDEESRIREAYRKGGNGESIW